LKKFFKLIFFLSVFFLRLKATFGNGNATAESLLVPGVLADLFEAVAGAIYKDSGFSRIAVLRSFNHFLRHAYGNKLKHGIAKMPWMDLRVENRAKEKNRKRTQSEPQGETSGESSKKTHKRRKTGK
jgi:dsRNA-specific ribonuclease